MSYQVLARKWRPRNFQEMVGQEHVLRMLINALEHQRLHHAYLFTGTRGVGKTTLARILSKCLNCEIGITATPCETCTTCLAINAGRYLDLLEIDAASRTKVEDTRELLENVFYAPTLGRYKIYLIDEVHMLSTHSFNALLKTLEEPPAHVKFILATTDPDRLPVTILSRCLQFNLKRVPEEQIAAHLENILQKETIPFEGAALNQLAHAADGSMRDALSLLDQAIAFCNANILSDEVRSMLGNIESDYLYRLLHALADKDGNTLLNEIKLLAEVSPNFQQVLENLLAILHEIALIQVVSTASKHEQCIQLAQRLTPQDVQLYYQIALLGRRDLMHASNPLQGFEMTLLRMLAFYNQENEVSVDSKPVAKIAAPAALSKPAEPKISAAALQTQDEWSQIIGQLGLSGMAYALASNCAMAGRQDDRFDLVLSHKHEAMMNKNCVSRLEESLSALYGKPMTINIKISAVELNTSAKIQEQVKKERLDLAVDAIKADVDVLKIMDVFGATLDETTVKAID